MRFFDSVSVTRKWGIWGVWTLDIVGSAVLAGGFPLSPRTSPAVHLSRGDPALFRLFCCPFLGRRCIFIAPSTTTHLGTHAGATPRIAGIYSSYHSCTPWVQFHEAPPELFTCSWRTRDRSIHA